MGEGSKFERTDLSSKGFGKVTKRMEGGGCSIAMETSMKGSGATECKMDKGLTIQKMELFTQAHE